MPKFSSWEEFSILFEVKRHQTAKAKTPISVKHGVPAFITISAIYVSSYNK
jgi:hypothetical protein